MGECQGGRQESVRKCRFTLLIIDGTIYHKCRDKEPGYLEDLSVLESGAQFNPEQTQYLRHQGKVVIGWQVSCQIYWGVYPEQALRVMEREFVSLEVPNEK